MAEKDKWERIYTVPLSELYGRGRHELRSSAASAAVREFVARSAKVAESEVSISEEINKVLWSFGGQRPPRRVKVKVVKEAGRARATLLGEEEQRKKREEEAKRKAEAKGKKEAPKEAKKEEKPAAKEEKPQAPQKKEETAEEKAQREKLEKVAEKATM